MGFVQMEGRGDILMLDTNGAAPCRGIGRHVGMLVTGGAKLAVVIQGGAGLCTARVACKMEASRVAPTDPADKNPAEGH